MNGSWKSMNPALLGNLLAGACFVVACIGIVLEVEEVEIHFGHIIERREDSALVKKENHRNQTIASRMQRANVLQVYQLPITSTRKRTPHDKRPRPNTYPRPRVRYTPRMTLFQTQATWPRLALRKTIKYVTNAGKRAIR